MKDNRVRLAVLAAGLFAVAACSGGDGDKGQDILADGGGEVVAPCEEGKACDDGDPCTYGDTCVGGLCVSQPAPCNCTPCVDATCDGKGGCIYGPPKKGWCLVNQTCYEEGQSSPDTPCLVCSPAESPTSFVPGETGVACQDGNPCTENDYCDNGDCLAGSPPSCADGVQCTVDECDPEEGCRHDPDHASCDDKNPCTQEVCSTEAGGCTNPPDDSLICGDGNVCTTNDRCENGKCVSDPEPMACDDSNSCTDDTCHPSFGCLYVFNENACDDQATCTKDDKCHYGTCIGTEVWGSCPACDLTFDDHTVKINKLRVGDGGHPGEALNIDGDLKTCSPSGNCELGLDNSLTLAGDFIDETIAQNLTNAGNPLIFVAEFVDPNLDGKSFTLNLYYAWLADENPDCDIQSEECLYNASNLNFNPLCKPQVQFVNTKIDGDKVTAGGSGSIFPFKMSFSNGKDAEIVMYAARMEATLVKEGDKFTGLKGVFGGAVTHEQLKEMIKAIPEEYIPVDVNLILTMVDNIPLDIDLDGDGDGDGMSIALVFEALPAKLAPYYY
ncbi:MAG: hypothetical protein FJ109_15020 [Deltaproteobacteria bacterium]|nr:hypothetical protein [Deltaproteobacteria bacterium]